jgi:hypothetical protein
MTTYLVPATSASNRALHQPTRRTRPARSRSHPSHSQRGARVRITYHQNFRLPKCAAQPPGIAPYVLKAETACISAAFCLQLLSLYLILHQAKQQVPLPESSPPPADDRKQDSNQLPATTDPSTDLQAPTATQPDQQADIATEATHHLHRVGYVAGDTRGQITISTAPVFLTPYDTLACSSWLSCLQGVLLCAALLCNTFIRRWQAAPQRGSAASSAAAAAAQLVRLEAVVEQHTAQLAAVTPQVSTTPYATFALNWHTCGTWCLAHCGTGVPRMPRLHHMPACLQGTHSPKTSLSSGAGVDVMWPSSPVLSGEAQDFILVRPRPPCLVACAPKIDTRAGTASPPGMPGGQLWPGRLCRRELAVSTSRPTAGAATYWRCAWWLHDMGCRSLPHWLTRLAVHRGRWRSWAYARG